MARSTGSASASVVSPSRAGVSFNGSPSPAPSEPRFRSRRTMLRQQGAKPLSIERAHLKPILRLGFPLVVNNLAYAGISFADTVMSGHIGPGALAAVSVGSNAFALLALIGTGMMMALSPIVAHDFGAG